MKLALPAALALLAATPAAAQQAQPAPAPATPQTPPKLLVVISVDQFSADLFAEYRARFTGGFARLLTGAVFPSGYQSHAATETCPGHSTILSGARPARTGIIANDWTDFAAPREDKTVYCAEDESVPGSTSGKYTVSDKHLKVPTLGEWMKLADPQSRVVSVAGKDRAAVMMGGHKVDELWWWDGKAFVSYAGRTAPAMVTRMNASVTERIGEAQEPLAEPPFCQARSRAFQLNPNRSVGDGRFARAAGDTAGFRASPEFDESILALGAGIATDMKLGQGAHTDLLILGASATDYVGHTRGTAGSEMCLQLLALDQTLGKLFAVLDQTGVDYAVALTADHGGHDMPERNREHAAPMAARVARGLDAGTMGKEIGAALGIIGPVLVGGNSGDVYFAPGLSAANRARVQTEAIKRWSANPQVEAVFTRAQIEATRQVHTPPETWTLLQRAAASYDKGRSGDLVIALKPRVTPIAGTEGGSIATHGSFWDYDRRVPILFWRKGMTGFEQPLSVETVDIAPTLASLIGVKVPVEIDGRCLDLDAGPGDTCR
ncbi:putative AlkP superfamily pyrophosphatase or phosphodiesterase [Sphingomonas naasensis]|uniref:Alkaline phosphatase n=1 Tax=Sphingomonas naasensis TaxID=1344951 RepID=A0A4S1WA08_9SPHN|nr:alkaline phosphatase family protein [Sphingomonas naasensis]NIJ19518.1 putative AlkP superfamily pyrophosphatase or phosphodiesterase [Sphingomonas naasensis]TGX39253.1 alkaline phosphatase family protein [Sphingomonas naasensis]